MGKTNFENTQILPSGTDVVNQPNEHWCLNSNIITLKSCRRGFKIDRTFYYVEPINFLSLLPTILLLSTTCITIYVYEKKNYLFTKFSEKQSFGVKPDKKIVH